MEVGRPIGGKTRSQAYCEILEWGQCETTPPMKATPFKDTQAATLRVVLRRASRRGRSPTPQGAGRGRRYPRRRPSSGPANSRGRGPGGEQCDEIIAVDVAVTVKILGAVRIVDRLPSRPNSRRTASGPRMRSVTIHPALAGELPSSGHNGASPGAFGAGSSRTRRRVLGSSSGGVRPARDRRPSTGSTC